MDSTKKSKKGSKKKRKDKRLKRTKDGLRVLNARGEMVTVKEYELEQTLDATNKSLTQYRQRMEGFIETNENLQEMCTQQEQDALEVIAALQVDVEKKSNDIKEREMQINKSVLETQQEKDNLKMAYERKLADINVVLNEKEAAFKVMQNEFSVIKDFRKKRHELLKDLESQKQELADTEKRHKEIVSRMERKFFEEKIRLQKDANRKISELATKAHKEAVANLKETTKEVYKENIRMQESLAYHVEEGTQLKKENERLAESNRSMLEEKELHDVIVKEKILQHKTQQNEVAALNQKIQSMEHSLSHVVREFEYERELIGKLAKKELEEVRKVAIRLRNNLLKKSAEMKHIKRLAQHILDQRTDLEKFFMDALDHVKKAAHQEKVESLRKEKLEYNKKVKMAMLGKMGAAELPPVKSFRPKHQTREEMIHKEPEKSIFDNEAGGGANGTADISELSWADKERVMRLLFAKMNGISYQGLEGGSSDEESGEEYEGSSYGSGADLGETRVVSIGDLDEYDSGNQDLQSNDGIQAIYVDPV